MQVTWTKVVASRFLLVQMIGISVLVFATPQRVFAQPAPVGWVSQTAELVSPEAAQTVIEQREQALAQQRDQQTATQSRQMAIAAATLAAPETMTAAALVPAATEFSQLAAALENDPRRIYQFVRNHFA